MSVELLSQCKRKLLSSISKIDKIIEMYDSVPLEKCLQDTCKSDALIKDTKQTLTKYRNEYQRSAQRLKEINDKVGATLAQ